MYPWVCQPSSLAAVGLHLGCCQSALSSRLSLIVVGVIVGDYSKLGADSLLFFRWGSGELPFFYFPFFRGADAPIILMGGDHPLPPIENSGSYPQAAVDTMDNFCKLLISFDLFQVLTDCLQNRFYTTSIMLTLNI